MKKALLEKIQNIISEAVLNEFKAAERGSQAERARYKACVRKAIKCGSWPAFYKKHHADYDFL